MVLKERLNFDGLGRSLIQEKVGLNLDGGFNVFYFHPYLGGLSKLTNIYYIVFFKRVETTN